MKHEKKKKRYGWMEGVKLGRMEGRQDRRKVLRRNEGWIEGLVKENGATPQLPSGQRRGCERAPPGRSLPTPEGPRTRTSRRRTPGPVVRELVLR